MAVTGTMGDSALSATARAVSPATRPSQSIKKLATIFAVAGCAILIAGFLHYRQVQRDEVERVLGQLDGATRLKVAEIRLWRRERLGDAQVVSATRPLGEAFSRWLAGDAGQRDLLQTWAEAFCREYRYQGIILFDRDAVPVLGFGVGLAQADAFSHQVVADAMAATEARLTDVHDHGPGRPGHIGLAGYMTDAAGAMAGGFVVIIDPKRFLYPTLERWDSHFRTSAVALLTTSGDGLVELAGSGGGAPSDLGLWRTIARAGAGHGERVEYGGRTVYAALQPVPESRWLIGVHVDRREVTLPLRQVGAAALLTVVALLMVTGVVLVLSDWRRDRLVMARERNASWERSRLAEDLRRKSEQMRTYFDKALIGMAVTAPNKGWVQVNPALTEIFGYSDAELQSMTWAEITHPDDLAADRAEFERVVTGETDGYQMDKRFIRKDGTVIFAHIVVSVVRSPDGTPDYFVAQVMDITEQKLMADRRIQLEKFGALGRLTAGVAHELNNPLMGIINGAQYCLSQTPDDDERHQVLQDVERETRRCVGIVKNLLAFSRTNVHGPRTLQEVDPALLVEQIARLLDYRASRDGITLSVDATAAPSRARVDAEGLRQVLMNLLTNAFDAVQGCAKRAVSVQLGQDAGNLVIRVRDTGVGIPPDAQGRIFDPFYTTKPAGRGTGLGLATGWSIVQESHGTLHCHSRPGSGTTMTVRLPLDPQSEVPTWPSAS